MISSPTQHGAGTASSFLPHSQGLVSVIMPFLNTASYIEEAIESVLAQTYDAWELLLINDGSSDGSRAIAERYAEQYPTRIRYFEHEGRANRGASVSRNVGIRHARGEYIAFLDSDDVYLPDNLERLTAAMDQYPDAAMAYRQTEYWHSWDSSSKSDDKIDHLGVEFGVHPPGALLARWLGCRITTPCTCSTIVRRDAIEKHGRFEDSFKLIFTDQAFYVKQALHSAIAVVDGHGARYRQHDDSACHTVSRQGTHDEARLAFLTWAATYLNEQPQVPNEVPEVLRAQLERSRGRLRQSRYRALYRLLTSMRTRMSQVLSRSSGS